MPELKFCKAMPEKLAHALAARFTEIREQEEAVVSELKSYKALLDMSPCPMGLTTKNGKVIYANQSYLDLLGVGLDDVLINGWQYCVAEEDRERVTKVWEQFIQSGMSETTGFIVYDTHKVHNMRVNWKARSLPDNGYAFLIFHPGCQFTCQIGSGCSGVA